MADSGERCAGYALLPSSSSQLIGKATSLHPAGRLGVFAQRLITSTTTLHPAGRRGVLKREKGCCILRVGRPKLTRIVADAKDALCILRVGGHRLAHLTTCARSTYGQASSEGLVRCILRVGNRPVPTQSHVSLACFLLNLTASCFILPPLSPLIVMPLLAYCAWHGCDEQALGAGMSCACMGPVLFLRGGLMLMMMSRFMRL